MRARGAVCETRKTGELMSIGCQFLAIGILSLMPLASMAQEVVTHAKTEVTVDWVQGTDFSKYKTYAWGNASQKTPDPKHPIEDIDAALQAKGLRKVERDANPSLLVAVSVGSKPVYVIQGWPVTPAVKQGTMIVQLADPQSKNALWWGVAYGVLTDKYDKDVGMIQKKVSKMFQKYPPPTKKN